MTYLKGGVDRLKGFQDGRNGVRERMLIASAWVSRLIVGAERSLVSEGEAMTINWMIVGEITIDISTDPWSDPGSYFQVWDQWLFGCRVTMMGRALGPLVHVMGEDSTLDRTHTQLAQAPCFLPSIVCA